MASNAKYSGEKPLPEFNLFTVPQVQATIEQDILSEHRPISTLDSKSIIEFNIPGAKEQFIRLDKTLLYIKLRINIGGLLGADVARDDWKKVSTVNNLMNSLFKQIDLTIGDRIINPAHHTYSYKTDFEIKLGKSKEAKDTFLASQFWFEGNKNEEEKIAKITDLIKPSDDVTDLTKSREIDLMGRLQLSMFEQPKALVGGTNIRLKFIPNDPSFYLMMDNDVKLKSVDFLDATLLVHSSRIARQVREGIDKALELANARYQLRESFVVPVTITKGTQDTIIDNVHNGQLPKRAFVAFVNHAAFNGSFKLNPYNYQNFGLCYLSFYLDGIQTPEKPFTPDFTNNLYVREYLSLFEATNQDNIDSCITIKREDFPKGNNIFAVNFQPDLTSGCGSSGHVNPIKSGTLRLQVRFKEALRDTITALIYLDYDTILEINRERNPIYLMN